MKEKPPKVEIDASDQSKIIIDGKKYAIQKVTTKKIDGILHNDKIIYKLLDNEEQFKLDKEVVIKAIGTKVNAKDLIGELIKDVSPKTMTRLAKRVREGKPIKRQNGCIGIKIGDAYIQLIE